MPHIESLERAKLSLAQRMLLAFTLWPVVLITALVAFVGRIASGSLLQLIIGAGMSIGLVCSGYFLHRFLKRGPFRAGMAVTFFGLFGGMILLGLIGEVLDDEEFFTRLESESSWQRFGDENYLHDESHLEFTIHSFGDTRQQGSAFSECIEELHRRSDTRAMRTEAIQLISNDIRDESPAEDAVHDVMIKVCLNFEDGKVEELRPIAQSMGISYANARQQRDERSALYGSAVEVGRVQISSRVGDPRLPVVAGKCGPKNSPKNRPRYALYRGFVREGWRSGALIAEGGIIVVGDGDCIAEIGFADGFDQGLDLTGREDLVFGDGERTAHRLKTLPGL